MLNNFEVDFLFSGVGKNKARSTKRRVQDWREEKRDIFPIPVAELIEDRDACEDSLKLFAVTFFALIFDMEFSEALEESIKNLETSMDEGGLYFQVLPRGSGKTVVAIVALLWAICYHKKRCIAIIAATQKGANKIVNIILHQLRTNKKLIKAFPEICYPFTQLKTPQGQSVQTYKGVPTDLSMNIEMLVIPTIEGSLSSGISVIPYGLDGAIRGEIKEMPDGSIARPDYFLVDDPQTTKSAKSQTQCEQREELIQADLLGLAGPGKGISGVVNGTIIKRNDMVEIFANGKYPQWEIVKYAFFISWPDDSEIWIEYLTIRETDNKKTWEKSNAFYLENREQMDKGAKVYWEARREEGAISGIQSGYNLIHKHGLSAFMSEYQNEPSEKFGDVELATKTDILSKMNQIPRNRIKAGMQYVTAGIDVHKHIIYYLVAAYQDGGTCQILDYGCYPKQRTNNFEMHSLSVRLGDVYKGTEPAIITQGLLDVVGMLSKQEYISVNEQDKLYIDKIFIDAGYQPACVQRVKTEHKALVVPSLGKGIKASAKPFTSYVRKPGEKHGHFLYYPLVRKLRDFRHCSIDVNYWKGFVNDGWLIPSGGAGEFTLFGTAKTNHDMLASHLTAETYTEVIGHGRKVREWKVKVGNPENHWFDCLVYASACASDIGMKLDDSRKGLRGKRKKKEKIKLSERQKNRRR
jgi:hypothetical protein